MGNSEVGHLNLGAGRIVYQDLTRINKAIVEGELSHNEVLRAAFRTRAAAACISSAWFRMAGCTAIRASDRARRKRRGRRALNRSSCTRSRTGATLRPLAGKGYLSDLCGSSCAERREDHHRGRPLFCDGPGPSLGADEARMGRDRSRARRNLRGRPAAAVARHYADRQDR